MTYATAKSSLKKYFVSPDIRRVPLPPPQILPPRKEGSLYFRVLTNKYQDDDYEEFQLIILMLFVKIPRLMFKVLHFESIITVLLVFAYSSQN
jgi:hypothetical protein